MNKSTQSLVNADCLGGVRNAWHAERKKASRLTGSSVRGTEILRAAGPE
jgi:hypothetical protein